MGKLEELRQMLGIEPSTFYSIVVTIVTMLLSVSCSFFKWALNEVGDYNFIHNCRSKNSFFFIKLYWIHFALIYLFSLIGVLLYLCGAFDSQFAVFTLVKVMFFSIISGVIIIRILEKVKWLEIGRDKVRSVRGCVFVFTTGILSGFFLYKMQVFYEFAGLLCLTGFVASVFEIVKCNIHCLEYEHGKAKIITTAGKEYICDDVSQLSKGKYTWRIKNGNEIIHLSRERVDVICFYGEPILSGEGAKLNKEIGGKEENIEESKDKTSNDKVPVEKKKLKTKKNKKSKKQRKK